MIVIKEIKEWVNQFPDEGTDVEVVMDCFHGRVDLVTTHNNIEYRLELIKDKSC